MSVNSHVPPHPITHGNTNVPDWCMRTLLSGRGQHSSVRAMRGARSHTAKRPSVDPERRQCVSGGGAVRDGCGEACVSTGEEQHRGVGCNSSRGHMRQRQNRATVVLCLGHFPDMCTHGVCACMRACMHESAPVLLLAVSRGFAVLT
jgi:hypothetical protein